MKNGFQTLLVYKIHILMYINFAIIFKLIFFHALIFFHSNILESVEKNNELINISELTWNTEFADVILEAIKEVNHNVSNINVQLDTGI